MSIYKIRLHLELNPGPDKVYTVTSPDLPELITEGRTPTEIAVNVQDAISCLLEGLAEFWLRCPASFTTRESV